MLLSLLFKVMAISLIHGVSSSGCGSRFQTRAGNQPKPERHLLLPFCLDTEKLIGLASLLSSPRPPLSRTSACLKSKTMIEMLPAMLPPTPPRISSPPVTNFITSLPPPLSPQRWKWRCHNCGAKYRIATTRRCLACSHYFCTTLTSPVVKPNPNSKRPKQLQKRRCNRTCASTFDYSGWARYNSWRRLALSSPSSSTSCTPAKLAAESYVTFQPTPLSFFSPASDDDEDGAEMEKVQWPPIKTSSHRQRVVLAKERLYVNKKHDCFLHCDYRSECRHMIFEAYEQGRVTLTRDNENGYRWEAVDPGPEPEKQDTDMVMTLF